jgi:hypothetical protein
MSRFQDALTNNNALFIRLKIWLLFLLLSTQSFMEFKSSRISLLPEDNGALI